MHENFTQFNDDLFSDEALRNSRPLYKKIRDSADAVWSPSLDCFIVGRFADVKAGLRANSALISGAGVTLNATFNAQTAGKVSSTIQSDGTAHRRLKQHSMRPLKVEEIAKLKDRVDAVASQRVMELCDTGEIEAMSALASHMPINVITNMVGIKQVDAKAMHAWSMAANDGGGPTQHPRTLAASERGILDLFAFLQGLSRDDVRPGSWVDQLFDAIDRGELEEHEARSMMAEYIAPALDTTAMAIGELLYNLAKYPETFDALKADPTLVSTAVNEAVRLATPIRGFTRVAAEDFPLSESTLPAGARVWLLNAAANLDERHYEDPERFDLQRNSSDQLSWGHGAHRCNGLHLARLEMECLLRALIEQVNTLELRGSGTRVVNNLLQGYETLPMVLHG